MTLHVFAGPSLPPDERPMLTGATWHPPAAGGDLLRLHCAPGDVVCLVDGAFETVPAVRHKEILLLLSRSVAVFGAASMGALRAAEMSGCGMIGIGRIHRAYARGLLAGDDWVAVSHAPAELGWRATTIALVDLAAGLQRAVRCRALPVRAAAALWRAGAGLYYQDRDWRTVERWSGIDPSVLAGFADWRASAWTSQKTLDARACVAAAAATDPPAPVAFVDTEFLRRFAASVSVDPGA